MLSKGGHHKNEDVFEASVLSFFIVSFKRFCGFSSLFAKV